VEIEVISMCDAVAQVTYHFRLGLMVEISVISKRVSDRQQCACQPNPVKIFDYLWFSILSEAVVKPNYHGVSVAPWDS